MGIKATKTKNSGSVKIVSGIIIVFVLACLALTGLSVGYYSKLHGTIREESKRYLLELSMRIGSDVQRIINDNFALLNVMASSLESVEASSMNDVELMLQNQVSYLGYASVMMVDKNGKAYSIDNKKVFMNLNPIVRENILSGKHSMSTTQIINNEEYILFSVPLRDVVLDGNEMVALVGSYAPSSFDKILSMISFDQKAYSQLITPSGISVTRSVSPYALKTGYNVFASLKEAQMDEGSSLEKLQKDISSGKEDLISFTIEGVHEYMVYTPIQNDGWYLLTFVPVASVNQKSDALLRTTLLISGFITLAFAGMFTAVVFLFNNHKRKLEYIAYVDPVTGGNTIQRFYKDAEKILNTNPYKQYALVYTNIEKFKVMNDQLGHKTCDIVLTLLNRLFQSTLNESESMGRLFADNFCLLVEYEGEAELVKRFEHWCKITERYSDEGLILWDIPMLQVGVYVIQSRDVSLLQMVDRAKLAMKEANENLEHKLRYGFYNDEVCRILLREKHLEDRMQSALANGEFKVFLQPKYKLPEEKVGGAEALVRWESPYEGMIFPNEFIPLFERNGFIVDLDKWVFEEVCKTMRTWIDNDLQPFKISVNCSRVNLKSNFFFLEYAKIAEKYNIDKAYLEIELTESIVMENSERLAKIITAMQDIGFSCSMDDFGSGYSSLNMVQNIPVNTLKLDRIFFCNISDLARAEAVVRSIVSMAHSLGMETVAEGVEQRDQVEMLKETGCSYIQGYVFAKPMRISAFEELTYGKIIS